MRVTVASELLHDGWRLSEQLVDTDITLNRHRLKEKKDCNSEGGQTPFSTLVARQPSGYRCRPVNNCRVAAMDDGLRRLTALVSFFFLQYYSGPPCRWTHGGLNRV